MEINNIGSALNVYKKIDSGYKKAAVKSSSDKSTVKNTDRVEFSAAASAEAEIASAKSEIKRSIDADASDARISALKDAVENGSYNVSPEKVAAAIFEA